MTGPATLCEAFQRTAAARGGAPAVRASVAYTWAEYAQEVRRIAGGLAALGVRRGDTVAFMLTNRPEFHLADTAAMHLGAITYSIYNSSSVEQIGYLLGHAESRVVVCERQFADAVRAAGGPVEHLLILEDGDLARLAPEPGFDLDAAWQAVRPDDVVTLIYTSGTTGPPKGVEITHRGALTTLDMIGSVLDFRTGDRCVSYLPTAHLADRMLSHYAGLRFGTDLTCVADLTTIAQVLPEVRPDTWGAVPRVWEKVKDGIESKLAEEAHGVKGRLIGWALDVGVRAARCRLGRIQPPIGLRLQHAVADRIILAKLRHALGLENLRWALTGSASTPPEVFDFFQGIGIPLTDVWGMSEIGLGTCASPDQARAGTVGPALPGVELRLEPDGELLARTPALMRGYRSDPERTAEAVDGDGWMHTGDIATIDDDGYLRIVDRKKDIIINSGGKNMSPSNIQNAVGAESPLIGAVMVVGDGRPYNVALITLDPEAAAAFAADHALDADPGVLAKDDRVQAVVTAAVEAGNARLSRIEQIMRFTILPAFWEPGSDELTPTMKLRRRNIAEKYAGEIEQLYA